MITHDVLKDDKVIAKSVGTQIFTYLDFDPSPSE